jgi:hypothetical protein
MSEAAAHGLLSGGGGGEMDSVPRCLHVQVVPDAQLVPDLVSSYVVRAPTQQRVPSC